MFFYWFMIVLFYLPLSILFPTRVKGRKSYSKKQGAILAANHQSGIDPFLVALKLRKELHFLAKHSLFKSKFGNWFFKHLNAIPVNRGEVGLSVIKECLGVLKQGKQLVVFPEGTRKVVMDEGAALKGGVVMFSLKADVPIIPMFFIKKPRFFRFNTLIIGEPFKLTEFEGKKLTSEVVEEASKIVGAKLLQLRENYYKEKEEKKNKKKNKR